MLECIVPRKVADLFDFFLYQNHQYIGNISAVFTIFFQTIEASSIPKQKWRFFGPRLVSPICVVGDEPLASSNRFGPGQMDNTTCTNSPILGRGWDSYPPVTPPKFNRNSPWKVTGPQNPQNGKDLLFQQSFLQGWAVELQVCRWDARGPKMETSCTWMSQEVSKWLVNGLQPTYKWGILYWGW